MTDNNNNTYYLCFTAEIRLDIEKHPKFMDALNNSNNMVLARIDFKKDGKPILDKEGYKEHLFEMDEDIYVQLEAA